jgi:hypothetical protein
MTTYTYVQTNPPGVANLWNEPNLWDVDGVETGGIPGAGDTAIVGGVTLESETLTDITIEGLIRLLNATLDTSVLLTNFGTEPSNIESYGDDRFAGTYDVNVVGVRPGSGGGDITLLGANGTLTNTGVINTTNETFSVANSSTGDVTFINEGDINATYGGFGITAFAELLSAGEDTGTFVNDGTINIDGTGVPEIADAEGGFYDTVSGRGTIKVTSGLLTMAGVADGQTIDFVGGGSKLQLSYSDFSTTPFLGQIEGFQPGDIIVLGATVTTADPSTPGVVRLFDGVTLVGSLDITPAPGKTVFTVTPGGGFGSELGMALACYAAGTRLASPGGEVAVEDLRTGEMVLTASGASRRVVWLGERRVDCARHPRPETVWPVRVRAGAFGDGLPRRDLRLSPDHAVFCGGVLIPVRHLINGATIAQEPVACVHYLHVELECHDLLLAEALPAESYLDTGNRSAFENGGAIVEQHPDFGIWRREAEACAPLVVTGLVLEQVRAQLAERASRMAILPAEAA